ncbi:MAG: hypothetical protein LBR19_02705 [Bifidobacteriaceae bacterium]|jgi:phage tail protein X|nr:hypothetical protein [Bifidobacteriaceae bacterium]
MTANQDWNAAAPTSAAARRATVLQRLGQDEWLYHDLVAAVSAAPYYQVDPNQLIGQIFGLTPADWEQVQAHWTPILERQIAGDRNGYLPYGRYANRRTEEWLHIAAQLSGVSEHNAALAAAQPDAIVFDGYPEYTDIFVAAKTADVDRLLALMRQVGDWETLQFLISQVTEVAGLDNSLAPVFAAQPGDPLIGTLLAGAVVEAGWSIRGTGWASSVSDIQWEAFHAYLKQAEAILEQVVQANPGYLPAWVLLLRTGKGLDVDLSVMTERYGRLHSAHPSFFPAQLAYMDVLLPKWGGSWELTGQFVDQMVAQAPLGALTRALPAFVHEQRIVEFDDEKPICKYFKDKSVAADVLRVAQESVLHPAHQPSPYTKQVRSLLAWELSLGNQAKAAAPLYQALGQYPASNGWSRLEGKVKNYLAARKKAR